MYNVSNVIVSLDPFEYLCQAMGHSQTILLKLIVKMVNSNVSQFHQIHLSIYLYLCQAMDHFIETMFYLTQ